MQPTKKQKAAKAYKDIVSNALEMHLLDTLTEPEILYIRQIRNIKGA